MSGRITYRRSSPQPGVLIQTFRLSDDARYEINLLLGREITEQEAHGISVALERSAFWLKRSKIRASAADVRATLKALAVEDDDDVHAAFEACDPTTRAHVIAVLVNETPDASRPDPEAIRRAAGTALARLRDRRGPRVTARRLLALQAYRLWQELGGPPSSPAVMMYYATPVVRFAEVLFTECGVVLSSSAIAKLMRAETRPAK